MRALVQNRFLRSALLIASCLFLHGVHAAPMVNQPCDFFQPDGTRVTLILNGDEFYLRAETTNGLTVIRDPQTGWICFANLSADGQELVSTGTPCTAAGSKSSTVHPQAVTTVSIEPHLDIPATNRLRQAKSTREALLGAHTDLVTPSVSKSLTLNAAAKGTITPLDAIPLPPRKTDLTNYSSTIHGLILVFDFPDAVAPASPTFQAISDSINQPNFHKSDGRANSLRTFYSDVSRGTFIVSNYVCGIFRATNTFSWYDSQGYGTGAQLLLAQGLAQLQSSGFDFSQLTVDSSHNVKDLCVLYTGNPPNWAQGMWFHSGWWGGGPTYNGVNFRQYCTTTFSADPGTLIHEHGHLIAGWPDLYSYNGATTGTWDVMGGGYTDLPCPYLLYQNGWLDATNILGAYGLRTMNTLDSHTALVYYDPNQPNEYFFLRPYTTSLLYSPSIPDQGLSIWRINPLGSNPDYPNRPLQVELVHANGVVANDSVNVLFKAAGRNRFTDTTSPGSWWAYNDHKGQRSGLNLTSIGAPGNTMSFRVSRPIYFYPVPTQITPRGAVTNLQITATSDTRLSYSATGLPAGLILNSATGLISGAPGTAGGYNVTITATATDGSQNTCEFAWLVGNGSSTAPASWYSFSGNLNDSSGYGRTGSAIGSLVYSNNGLVFNGSNSAVSVPRPMTGDFTIAFFMKTAVSGKTGSQWYSGSGLVDGEVAGLANDFGVTLTGDQVTFGVGSTSSDVSIQSQRKVTDGQWHHIAATRSSTTGALALYIDGVLDASGAASTGTKTSPPSLRLGSLQTGIQFYNGTLDEVRLYTTVVPAEEIYRLSSNKGLILPLADPISTLGSTVNLNVPYTNLASPVFSATGLPPGISLNPSTGLLSGTLTTTGVFNIQLQAISTQSPDCAQNFTWAVCPSTTGAGPVAWYPLTRNALDSSGNGRNGILVGAPGFPYRGAMFKGISDAIQIPRSISGDFTISFFINTGSPGDSGSQWYNGDGLVDGEVSGAAADFGVSLTGDKIAFGVGSTSGDTTIQSDHSVTDRAWHHVAATRSSSTGAIALYIDGKLEKAGTASTGLHTAPPVLRLGSLQTAIHFFRGSLAEVKLYGRILSAPEVFQASRTIQQAPEYPITDFRPTTVSSNSLTWSTALGEFYQVETTTNLGQPFAPVGQPSAGVDGNVTRTVPATGTSGFYRVRRL
jgi:M6 family metalloprotease-like protein